MSKICEIIFIGRFFHNETKPCETFHCALVRGEKKPEDFASHFHVVKLEQKKKRKEGTITRTSTTLEVSGCSVRKNLTICAYLDLPSWWFMAQPSIPSILGFLRPLKANEDECYACQMASEQGTGRPLQQTAAY